MQYRSYSSTGAFTGVIPLGDHHIEAGGRLLVGGGPTPPTVPIQPGRDIRRLVLRQRQRRHAGAVEDDSPADRRPRAVLGPDAVVDVVGYGASTTYEEAAPHHRATRHQLAQPVGDRDVHRRQRGGPTGAAPSPVACGDTCDGTDGPVNPPVEKTIAEIQGDGPASLLAGKDVITTGVVMAVYNLGVELAPIADGRHGKSDRPRGGRTTLLTGIFVFSSAFAAAVDKAMRSR